RAADHGEQRRPSRRHSRQPEPRSGHGSPHARASASRRLKSRSGLALDTYGTRSKLCGGGGEVVYHSSVSASQGSFPARRPFCEVTTTFERKTKIPTPMIPEPIVEARLYHSQSPPWLYV